MDTAIVPTPKFSELSLPNKPGVELQRLIELCADVDLTNEDRDRVMMMEFPELINEGRHIGSTAEKIKMYPLLKGIMKESRVLNWAKLGVSRIDAYRRIKESMDAVRYDMEGVEHPDFKERREAAKDMLASVGEKVTTSGDKSSMQIAGNGNKIVVVTSEGAPLSFPGREDGN